jgi:hypothetical protein
MKIVVKAVFPPKWKPNLTQPSENKRIRFQPKPTQPNQTQPDPRGHVHVYCQPFVSSTCCN